MAMDNDITLTWTSRAGSSEYFINGVPEGRDEPGFINVLKFISESSGFSKVRVRFSAAGFDDGRDLQEHFPFYRFYPEFEKIIAGKGMLLELIPEF
jgi:hypothetical protein